MTIDDFLATNYVKFGRNLPDLDCWGLVRLARVELFGRDLLPSYVEIDPQDKRELTAATLNVQAVGEFKEVSTSAGAIATAWRGRLCVHVGIVVECDGRLWVLETDETTGPALTRPQLFESRYTQVIYYDN